VESIPLHEEAVFTALAFALPGILQQWGGHIQEIALDSACMFYLFNQHYQALTNSREYKWLQL
jgi:hypothetical protein